MNMQKYVVVDIETTGHSPAKGDRIIQIALVTIENGDIVDTYTKFINPGRKIPVFIQDLTNISDKDVADASPFETYAETIFEKLEDAIFVAHNTNFDLNFLQAELKRSGMPKWHGLSMDTVELTRLMYPTAFSYKLQDITAELGIPLTSAHRADDDAVATAHLFLQAKEDMEKLPYDTLAFLHKRSFQLKSDLSRLVFELMQKKRNAQPDSFERFNGIPLKIRNKVASIDEEPLLTGDWAVRMEKAFPNFELRQSQLDMMGSIQKTLLENDEMVIEASTGMGKTIAYLLPAAEFAFAKKKQVVISTYTTHLQDQLVQNEGKIVEKIIGKPIRIALIKGLGHYIDLTRFMELLQGDDESYDETFTIMQVLIWLTTTETGDLNELNASSGGQFLIDKIRRSHLRRLTPQEKRFDYYENALKEAKEAHVIVTNHAFLLNYRMPHSTILENVGAYIWDEAHQVVQAAVAQHEKTFVYTQWKYVFGQLGLYDEQQLFGKLYEVAERTGFSTIPELLKLESLFIKFVEMFDEVSGILSASFLEKFRNSRHQKCSSLLSELQFDKERFFEMLRYLNEWIDLSQLILQKAERHKEKSIHDRVVITDWRYWTEEMMLKSVEFSEIFVFPLADEVSWIEGDLRSLPNSLSFYKRPFEVTSLVENVIGPVRGQKAVIWLSGTMSVPTNERFIVNQLGIPNSVPITKFEPPKDFYQGARVFIVEDMPDIQQVSQSDYIESVADAVIQTVLVTEGRCFVLFTSQDMLRKTVELIQDTGLLEDYMLFAQGISSGSRLRLLKSFQRFQKSVLFGTNSFWEGVDVPGDALRAVVVVRLPFTSPDEPIFKARSEVIAKEGVNPFLQYALPEAVLRLRQGFGRLIRSKNDKGLFIVLDRRIETKSYGKEFLSALPKVKVSKVSLEKMVTDIEDWYNKQ
ncbi:ATP-dependent DNA helicase DinG [Planococcus shixiaomingii]|uniref:ATP-dependent DNA helicase DinG n=1 Tax=Planococcus shixiaomingii TaxID=3058393 RepID=UPI0026129193|nr:ATP-dependent DNA helicase DinG [Planococcus sp. N022]WKA53340.1 ATP-dependent DNA helicase DinG [Planococcus sp. N022]